MLATGYISENAHFPDEEFQQIVAGMRTLKPACDEFATASAANNMASMQAIDQAVLQLVKDCGKWLTKTIRTNKNVPPPGPGVPLAQVIVNRILQPLNALPQCQWSIATAVPNAGPVGQNPPQPKAYLLPRRIPKRRTILNPQARQIPNLKTIHHPQAQQIPGTVRHRRARRIPKFRTILSPQAQQLPHLRTILHPKARRMPRTLFHPLAWQIPNPGLFCALGITTSRKILTLRRISQVRTILTKR